MFYLKKNDAVTRSCALRFVLWQVYLLPSHFVRGRNGYHRRTYVWCCSTWTTARGITVLERDSPGENISELDRQIFCFA